MRQEVATCDIALIAFAGTLFAVFTLLGVAGLAGNDGDRVNGRQSHVRRIDVPDGI